jgi:hypothetical protein
MMNKILTFLTGLACLVLTAQAAVLEDDFNGTEINTELWSVSETPYETGAITVQNFGLRDGSLVGENFVGTMDYWGAKALLSNQSFTASGESPVKITVDFGPLTCFSGVSVGEGIILRTLDYSSFFAIRNCRSKGGDEFGWGYNLEKSVSATKPDAWLGFDSYASSVSRTLEVTYDGTTLSMALDGVSGGNYNWTCTEPFYIELGFYARETGASGSGSFDGIKVEKEGTPEPQPEEELLFEDDFSGTNISVADWALDTQGFEQDQYPDATGRFSGNVNNDLLTMNFSTQTPYWPGAAYITTQGYSFKGNGNLRFVVDRKNFTIRNGSTGARCAILLRSDDGSKWIMISESYDGESGEYVGWGWNKQTGAPDDTPAGRATIISAFQGFSAGGVRTVELIADGQNVEVYLDGTYGLTLDFPVSEGIHLGLGVYARASNDFTIAQFDGVKIYREDLVIPPPVITSQPESVSTMEGSPVSFTVEATGVNLTYTWYKDDVELPGSNTPSYKIGSVTYSDEGSYTVTVSNEGGSVTSQPATLIISKIKLFSDDFVGPDLGGDWMIDTKGFEYSQYPQADGVLEYMVIDGLHAAFTANGQYWPGRTYYLKDTYSASESSPLIFEIDREGFGYPKGITGARCSIVLSSSDGTRWINFSECYDSRNYGWGWNKRTGASNDKDNGVVNSVSEFSSFGDGGSHLITVTLNGKEAAFTIDGVKGLTLDFPVSEGIRLGVGLFARADGDAVWVSFRSVNVWGPAPVPVESPELAYSYEDGKLILRWAASARAELEFRSGSTENKWILAGEAEIRDGTCYYEIPVKTDESEVYYRLSVR